MTSPWWLKGFEFEQHKRDLRGHRFVRRHTGGISQRRRKRILERDGHVCRECGAIDGLTLDHIKPRARGGTNHEANLQILCADCNQRKGSR